MLNNKEFPKTTAETVIRRRKGKIVGRIDHREDIPKGVEMQKIEKGDHASSDELKKIERNLKTEIAGWKANNDSKQITRKEAEEKWKEITSKK